MTLLNAKLQVRYSVIELFVFDECLHPIWPLLIDMLIPNFRFLHNSSFIFEILAGKSLAILVNYKLWVTKIVP
jgi:hypothetical protein